MRKRLFVVLLVVMAVMVVAPSAAMARTRTRMSIGISSSLEHYDRAPYVYGTLKTSSGRVLKYQYVKLYCGSTYVGRKRTNSLGKVKFSAVLPGSRTSGNWKFKYAGNSSYYPVASASKYTHVHWHYAGLAPFTEGSGVDDYIFQVDTEMEPGRTYQILTSDTTICTVNDSSGETAFASEDYYEWYWFEPDFLDTYSIYLDTGGPDVGDSELWVGVW